MLPVRKIFYPLHKLNIARAWQQENTFIQAFRSGSWLLNLHV